MDTSSLALSMLLPLLLLLDLVWMGFQCPGGPARWGERLTIRGGLAALGCGVVPA